MTKPTEISLYQATALSTFDLKYSGQPPFQGEDAGEDFQDFIVLVSEATEVGSTAILDKWAIQYPADNRHLLAEPLSYYASNMREIIIDNWEGFNQTMKNAGVHPYPNESKIYWEYLANGLANKG